MIDIEQPDQLLDYLRRTARIGADETPTLSTLAGGVSNRTVLVTRPSGEAWVMKQALAKLRVKKEWFADPARIHREALAMSWLARFTAPGIIPQLIFGDEAHHLLAMEAVPQPHENWKTMLLDGRGLSLVGEFAVLLGAIHRCSSESVEARQVFDDRSFFESLRIEPYYQHTSRTVTEAAEFLDTLIGDTRHRRLAVVHGDFSPKNILVYAGSTKLIDHEVIHWGDPAFDVGFALTHLLSKAHHLPVHRDRFLRAAGEFVSAYRTIVGGASWSSDWESPAVRHTLGCLLARVAGRSPLEYLDVWERTRQRAVVIELMHRVPDTLEELIARFAHGIWTHAAH